VTIKSVTARDVTKLSGLARQAGFDVTFNVLLSGKSVVLSDIRPDVTAKGNPSIRTICLRVDGKEMRFDGHYEFRLTGFPDFRSRTSKVTGGAAARTKSGRRKEGEVA
jgi:hypothetical protein